MASLALLVLASLTWMGVLCQDAIPPSILEQAERHVIYLSDSTIELPCVAVGTPPPEYEWYRNGQPLELIYNIEMSDTDGTLTIDPATSLDEGYYQCRATNEHGVALTIDTHLQRAVLGMVAPSDPISYTGNVGEPLVIPCDKPKSIPEAFVSWSLVEDEYDHMPDSVTLSDRVTMDEYGNLYFAHLTLDDEESGNLYRCSLFNPMLDMSTGGSLATIDVVPETPVETLPTLLFSSDSNVVVLVGEEVRLMCFFAGYPTPEVMFGRAQESLPEYRSAIVNFGTEIYIWDVRQEDEGQYVCFAENDAGRSAYIVIELEVEAVPTFIPGGQPVDSDVMAGDDHRFLCRTEAEPSADVVWMINGEPIDPSAPGPRMEILDDGTALAIHEVVDSDRMAVQCNASNQHGYVFSSGYLNVLPRPAPNTPNIPPYIVEQAPRHIVYRTYDTVHLPCVAEGTPAPDYEWYRNDYSLPIDANIEMSDTDGTITIDPATSLDEGYYQCRAINNHGVALSVTTYLQKAVLGRFPPDEPIPYTGTLGQPLIVACISPKAVPEAIFSWSISESTSDDNPASVPLSARITMDEYGNLYFTNLLEEDSQDGNMYRCNVFNPYLDMSTGGFYSTIHVETAPVNGTVPSLLYSTESPIVAVIGQEVSIECIFAGLPTPEVFIYSAHRPLPEDRTSVEGYGTELVIRDVREEDQGVYMCVGENEVGRSQYGFVVLEVESAPRFIRRNRPVDSNVTVGDDHTFRCRTEAEPLAEIQWMINGEPVDREVDVPRVEISEDYTALTITNVQYSDTMVVQCNASNVHGYAFSSGYLNVIELP